MSGYKKHFIFEYRSIFFYFFYGIYIIFFEDLITQITRQSITEKIPNYPMGFLILFLQIIELVALIIKSRALIFRLSEKHFNIVLTFLIWGFHAVLSILLINSAMNFFGYSGKIYTFMFPLVIKELLIFYPVMELMITEKKKFVSNLTEFIADFILLINLCIVYSVVWKGDATFSSTGTGRDLLYYTSTVILFLMLYIPMSFAEIIENIAESKKLIGKIKLGFCIILPVICMLIDL